MGGEAVTLAQGAKRLATSGSVAQERPTGSHRAKISRPA